MRPLRPDFDIAHIRRCDFLRANIERIDRYGTQIDRSGRGGAVVEGDEEVGGDGIGVKSVEMGGPLKDFSLVWPDSIYTAQLMSAPAKATVNVRPRPSTVMEPAFSNWTLRSCPNVRSSGEDALSPISKRQPPVVLCISNRIKNRVTLAVR